MHEFDIIETYFKPLTENRPEAGGLVDDAAVLSVPAGHELVVSSDTLNEGVHFFSNVDPVILAQKCLRVNVSDLIAMGAEPYCYQLCITFAETPDEAWLRAFCGALLEDQKQCGIFCSGGDTTRGQGGLSVTITAMGLVPKGKAVPRSGAREGDILVVTGALGLSYEAVQRGEVYVPPLRHALVGAVRDYAHAAIDISDGLLADAGHIAKASGLGISYSDEILEWSWDHLTGGEDYELALAVDPARVEALLAILRKRGLEPFLAGVFVPDGEGTQFKSTKAGWQHF